MEIKVVVVSMAQNITLECYKLALRSALSSLIGIVDQFTDAFMPMHSRFHTPTFVGHISSSVTFDASAHF